ncbi:uncharacterized protein LOC106643362 [Copidosoma floridanum]|uniref:uncharacterized protein LOC106643362 n=1 Tax=Copidosoma floridanum TaxID=29053 RepID=UPI0006C9C277|nr:uncharacterized protein LOC106643362 [Copidosoma floridanum]
METQSLDSIIQALEPYTRLGKNISPYLSAIQSLDGTTPGDKYRGLNQLVNETVKNKEKVGGDITTELIVPKQISTALVPLWQIRVGKALRSNEAVIQALTSEDIPVINQAFQAKWFFKATNEIVTADNFVNNIMPLVSKRTRFRIIKALSQGLKGNEKKAEEFHGAFVALYGVEKTVPLLAACGEKYIEGEVSRANILPPYEVLFDLFKKYPNLVIGCLRRFVRDFSYTSKFDGDVKYMEERKIFEKFLPHLIRRHIAVFIELYHPKYYVKIGRTNTDLFFKQAKHIVVDKALTLKNLFSVQTIGKKLSLRQFEIFFAKLFPDKADNFHLEDVINYLKCYPKEKREQLFTNVYRAKYSREFSFHKDFISFQLRCNIIHDDISVELFEQLFIKVFPTRLNDIYFGSCFFILEIYVKYSKEQIFRLLDKASLENLGKSLFDDVFSLEIDDDFKKKLLRLMSPENRALQVLKFLKKLHEKSNDYYAWYVYVPPKESLVTFKNAIAKSSDKTSRHRLIEHMVQSCAVDCSNDDLLDFLEYYNRRHKNEQTQLLCEIFEILHAYYDPSKFERSQFKALLELLWRVHTKGELTKYFELYHIKIFLDAAVHQILIQNEDNLESMGDENQVMLNEIFEIIVQFNWCSDWMFLKDNYELLDRKTLHCVWNNVERCLHFDRFCFEKLMSLLPQKFPSKHCPILLENSKLFTKSKVAYRIIREMLRYNAVIDNVKIYHDPDCAIEKLSLKNYPRLLEIIKQSLQDQQCYGGLINMMRTHEPEIFHQYYTRDEIVDDETIKREIKTGEAIVKLNKDQGLIGTFENYLGACQELLKWNAKNGSVAARRLLLTTKWYKDLPSKIIESCLLDIKNPGSLKVLGIMLEGDVFSKIVTPFSPKNASFGIHHPDFKDYYVLLRAALSGMNLTSPPVSFDVINMFCLGDCVKLAQQTFTNTSERVTKSKFKRFAEKLLDKPISVKKYGIRLLFKITTQEDMVAFIKRLWTNETHSSIRQMIASLVVKRFVLEPNDNNWELVQICIDALTEKDDEPFKVLSNVKKMNNYYKSRCIRQLLSKIKTFPDQVNPNGVSKLDWIGDLLKNAFDIEKTSEFLTEELILDIVNKYCFVEPSVSTIRVLEGAETFTKNAFGRPFTTKYYKFSFNSYK